MISIHVVIKSSSCSPRDIRRNKQFRFGVIYGLARHFTKSVEHFHHGLASGNCVLAKKNEIVSKKKVGERTRVFRDFYTFPASFLNFGVN